MSNKDSINWQKVITILDKRAKSRIKKEYQADYKKLLAESYAQIIKSYCGGCPDRESDCDVYSNCADCWLVWAVRESTKG